MKEGTSAGISSEKSVNSHPHLSHERLPLSNS